MNSSLATRARPLQSLGCAGVLLALAACHTDEDRIPQLSPARPGTLAVCETLRNSFTANGLVISASTRVAAGTLTVGGQPVGAHCLVTAKLGERVSSVDGQTYAIQFEMRLPEAWNGRFLYQANGGLDGNVNAAAGGFGGGPVTNGLRQGFAIVSSDAGHTAAQNPNFGVDP